MNPFRLKFVPCFLALGVFIAVQTIASAATWMYVLDTTTTLPTDAGWTISGNNPNVPQPEGLTIPAGVYYQHSFEADNDVGWTLEIVAKRADAEAGFGSLLYVADGVYGTEWGFYGQDRYRTRSGNGDNAYVTAPGSDNTQFVTIHITRKGDEMKIYFDDSDTPVATFSSTVGNANMYVRLGDYTTGNPVSVIQSIKWTTEGAYLPSQIPEPRFSFLLLPVAAGGLYLLRRRRLAKPVVS